jgi:DNA-binding NtrC family response regulator
LDDADRDWGLATPPTDPESRTDSPASRAGTILVVDDEPALLRGIAAGLAAEGYRVLEADHSAAAYEHLGREVVDLVLLDLRLGQENGFEVLAAIRADWPDTAVIMLTAHGELSTAVEAIKRGAFDFFPKPFDFEKLLVSVQNAIAGSALKEEVRFLRQRQRPRGDSETITGRSPAMREVAALVERVAESRSTVLLLGETGVGKEVIARAVHEASADAAGPFVDVNCASIPNELLESELFGHEKGSFTSADRQKKGLFETAHGGTLFLDEIGEMSLGLQSKLLRVLEQRRFRRVGGTQDLSVAVRVIAATNRDLREQMQRGAFRDDLYYRLAVVTIRIPPLRERIEDLDPLMKSLLLGLARDLGREPSRVSPAARELLQGYAWRGNVRELKNVLERAVLLGGAPVILPEHLPAEIRSGDQSPVGFRTEFDAGEKARPVAEPALPRGASGRAGILTLEDAERAAIQAALSATRGNKTLAARYLGISRQTLRTKIRKYGIADEVPITLPEAATV